MGSTIKEEADRLIDRCKYLCFGVPVKDLESKDEERKKVAWKAHIGWRRNYWMIGFTMELVPSVRLSCWSDGMKLDALSAGGLELQITRSNAGI